MSFISHFRPYNGLCHVRRTVHSITVNYQITMHKYNRNSAMNSNHMKSAAGFMCAVQLLFMPLLMSYTGCPRRNMPDFGRVFLMLKYTDITQNTYFQSWTVTEIMAREKCGLLAGPRTVPVSWHSYPCPSLSVVSYYGNSAVKQVLYFSTVM